MRSHWNRRPGWHSAQGGNLGGLAGADAKCLALATASGGGDHTWRAYLSTSAANGGVLINAKDRIGTGPWRNRAGTLIANDVASLHLNGVPVANIRDEAGAVVPANAHDILTGSTVQGNAMANNNCANWTSNTSNDGAAVGHHDGAANNWNFAHINVANGGNNACSQNRIEAANGRGRTYCFAID